MKFALLVLGHPASSQSAVSALQFARAVLRTGNEIYRVFFYADGVLVGNQMSAPPQDELDITREWREFAREHDIELIACVASALRRGMLDATEANRYEKPAATLDDAFTISGLGQLIDSALSAERLVTFAP